MKKNVPLIVVIILLLSGSVFSIMDKISDRKSRELEKNKQRMKDEEIQHLLAEKAELQEILKKEKEVIEPTPEKLADVFGEAKPSSETTQESAEHENIVVAVDCGFINKQINNFFSYLDKRDYIKEYQIRDGTYAYLKKIITKLYEQIPIAGETHSPGDILKNAYHFYRTISKKNILLIKDIIEKEKDIVEKTMDYFYQQQTHCKDTEKFFPPFDALYEYSHFFLNTMGGKAYLFRLYSRMRILLLYYSTMIIHEANLREINKYGIDIRPHINSLEDELNHYSKLYYSDKYLREVELVKKKYPVHSSAASS